MSELNRFTSAHETTGATPAPLGTSDERVDVYAENLAILAENARQRGDLASLARVEAIWERNRRIEEIARENYLHSTRRAMLGREWDELTNEERSGWLARAAKSAPAGQPLHEQADRDADNVPSDRVRAYAEAFRARKGPRCAECVELDDWSDCAECDAVVAVEVADREQAELRAEIERWRGRADRRLAEAKKAEATIARVEALRDLLVALGNLPIEKRPDGLTASVDACAALAGDLDDALRGPEPTDAP